MFGDGSFGEFAFAEPRAVQVPTPTPTPGAGGMPHRIREPGLLGDELVRDDEEVLIVLATIL